jgi:hypothetical protein
MYSEVETRISEFGDLSDVKLKLLYSHEENPVRNNFHKSVYLHFLFHLQKQLTLRFPDYPILVWFCELFDPELLIKGKDQENYGQMELGNLIDHYAGKVTKGDISKRQRLEWKSVQLDNTDRRPQPAEFSELAEDAEPENQENELPDS